MKNMSGNFNVFGKYTYNDFFVETGSYKGQGIDFALESGFKSIVSIEITELYYKLCKEKYKDNKGVIIVLGDSSKVLKSIISKINKSITFWLDGHYCEPTTTFSNEAGWFPILQELDAIKQHKIKNHTILIDDWRCFDRSYPYYTQHNISQEMIKNKILEINSNYKFSYEDGYTPNDVFVAQV